MYETACVQCQKVFIISDSGGGGGGGKGSLKCFEIRMPQVFQDSQVAGNIYASCDTPIGLLFSAVIIYDFWTYFLFEWENHPPWRETKKKWDRLMPGAGPPIQQQRKRGKLNREKYTQIHICFLV